ncbi:MAG: hypothetical protein MJE12_21535 [Alphaproteobacteria bacterium]|nr:hypothetical protein [Alphaproteobacteria bacterium]
MARAMYRHISHVQEQRARQVIETSLARDIRRHHAQIRSAANGDVA